MSDSSQTNINSSTGKYLTFMVSKERYGLDILKVQEIIKMTQITSVPKCPQYVKGVINLRGRIIPVFDLRTKFGIAAAEYNHETCIIIVNLQTSESKLVLGVIVDSVLEVISFSQEELEPSPNYGSFLESQFVVGRGKKDENLNILVDIDKLIGHENLSGLPLQP